MPGRVRVLIVEDKADQAERLERACLGAVDRTLVLVEWAQDAAQAHALLARQHFDLAVCDLSIPRDQASMAPDREHGLDVVKTICEAHSGLPLIVLSDTGSDPEILRELMRAATKADPYGLGSESSMLVCHAKEDLPECLREVAAALERSAGVAALPVNGPDVASLGIAEIRTIQVFARRWGGSAAEVEGMGGGLSGAKTLRLRVLDDEGQPTGLVAAKLGSRARVLQEQVAYNQASMLLPPGVGVPLSGIVDAGAGGAGGAFYRLADAHARDLFECLANEPGVGPNVVTALAQAFEPVHRAGNPKDQTVLNLRRSIVGAADAGAAGALDSRIRALDTTSVRTLWCLQHGDLHGKNVLVEGDGEPVVIDYGDVRKSTGCLDPATLELSTLFHPAAQATRGGWPTVAQAAAWRDLDAFVAGCPFEDYIRACREWSDQVAASSPDLDATVLAYCLRQLRFSGCPTDLAVALIEQACAALE